MRGSCYDRVYPVFSEGDEVYTEKKHFKAISSNTPYTVLRCYRPSGYVDGYPIVMIEIMSDLGFISCYATDRFLKTPCQIRHDKIKEILFASNSF